MAQSGSRFHASRNDRTASGLANAYIIWKPWSKNACASAFFVEIGRVNVTEAHLEDLDRLRVAIVERPGGRRCYRGRLRVEGDWRHGECDDRRQDRGHGAPQSEAGTADDRGEGCHAASLAARGATPAAFDCRCIPPRGVAPPLNIPDICGRRALRSVVGSRATRRASAALSVRLADRPGRLGATRAWHHGLLAHSPPASLSQSRAVGDSSRRAVERQAGACGANDHVAVRADVEEVGVRRLEFSQDFSGRRIDLDDPRRRSGARV